MRLHIICSEVIDTDLVLATVEVLKIVIVAAVLFGAFYSVFSAVSSRM